VGRVAEVLREQMRRDAQLKCWISEGNKGGEEGRRGGIARVHVQDSPV
jgi:hypothetical protein